LLQEGLAIPIVLGSEEQVQQIVQITLNTFAKHETMIPGKFAGVIAGPQYEVICLRDNR
jgi:hypothetical protein